MTLFSWRVIFISIVTIIVRKNDCKLSFSLTVRFIARDKLFTLREFWLKQTANPPPLNRIRSRLKRNPIAGLWQHQQSQILAIQARDFWACKLFIFPSRPRLFNKLIATLLSGLKLTFSILCRPLFAIHCHLSTVNSSSINYQLPFASLSCYSCTRICAYLTGT